MSAMEVEEKNGFTSSHNTELTQEEADLYDRQIRLWGVESQKRLRCARVLIIGLQGYGCEIAKNIILSGVKSVTLLDDGVLTTEDACAQFLAPRDQIGKNRAEASLARAQQLNPMVQVTADTENVAAKPDSFFRGFDVVCATKCPTEQLIRVDELCRKAQVLFFCGDVCGMFGYIFADLGSHVYEEQTSTFKPVAKNIGSGEATKPADSSIKINVTSTKTANFIPLKEALNASAKKTSVSKRQKQVEPSFYLMKVLLRFRTEHGRNPSPGSRTEDLATLQDLREKELTALQVAPDVVSDELLSVVFAEVAPVCAILGGVTVQEIIKAVSKKEEPHRNFFFFNPMNCAGFVQSIGC